MIAMRELKFPMLKHSRATSMKNSMTCARCFFFAGWKPQKQNRVREVYAKYYLCPAWGKLKFPAQSADSRKPQPLPNPVETNGHFCLPVSSIKAFSADGDKSCCMLRHTQPLSQDWDRKPDSRRLLTTERVFPNGSKAIKYIQKSSMPWVNPWPHWSQ